MKELLELYLEFLKIGAVNFGGGYAMLPLLERELSEKRNWVTRDELLDYFAVGQCTPGLIALNVSTFIGARRKGVLGGIIATLGFVTVPIAIILVISALCVSYAELPAVKNAFAGVRVCVCVLILQAVLRLWKSSIRDGVALAVYLIVLGLTLASSVLPVSIPTVALVISAGLFGLLYRGRGKKK